MRSLLAILAVTSACSLYTGNGDDTKCAGGEAPPEQVETLINPNLNQCETFDTGGVGDCGCLPCEAGSGSQQYLPDDWAQCSSACTGLVEAACLTTSGCHATYQGTSAAMTYWTCDAVAPSSGNTDACSTLDDQGCSTRDDCRALFFEQYPGSSAPSWIFEACSDDVLPTGPGSCTGVIACRSAEPVCPTGTVAGIANGCYTGYCIPENDCAPGDPGTCDANSVSCNIAPPMCPSDTVPGVLDHCWTGYCIPTANCP